MSVNVIKPDVRLGGALGHGGERAMGSLIGCSADIRQ